MEIDARIRSEEEAEVGKVTSDIVKSYSRKTGNSRGTTIDSGAENARARARSRGDCTFLRFAKNLFGTLCNGISTMSGPFRNEPSAPMNRNESTCLLLPSFLFLSLSLPLH